MRRVTHYSIYDILGKKRRGESLSDGEIAWFIDAFNRGEAADYQMTALLMAVAIRGMERREVVALTSAMIASGEQWRLRERFDFIADKHSTGGVGDKVSLSLTPWVAACGVNIAMLSGRGLGHTGGTLDKLDAIPGFNARLGLEELIRVVQKVGGAIATSTTAIAPADRRMYALRDVTSTVESIPLITASIMSKKLAMGPSGLLLDVKYGSGAFMKTEEEAVRLSESLIAAADGSGTTVEALITSMERPLGIAIGNANETIEAIQVLATRQPADLYELTKAQALRILVMSGHFNDASADAALEKAIDSGAALKKAKEWIEAQGGDPSFMDDPTRLPQPRRNVVVESDSDGYITAMDTYAIGMLSVELGAGRLQQEDQVDPAAGILVHRATGERVSRGEPLATIQLGTRELDDSLLRDRYRGALKIGDHAPVMSPLISRTIRKGSTS